MAAQLVVLRLLRHAAADCQLIATSFSDEQAAECLAVADELRAHFPRSASAPSSTAPPLMLLPPELLSEVVMSHLGIRDLARLATSCRSLWFDAPTHPPTPRVVGLVEAQLRHRAKSARPGHLFPSRRCLLMGAVPARKRSA